MKISDQIKWMQNKENKSDILKRIPQNISYSKNSWRTAYDYSVNIKNFSANSNIKSNKISNKYTSK